MKNTQNATLQHPNTALLCIRVRQEAYNVVWKKKMRNCRASYQAAIPEIPIVACFGQNGECIESRTWRYVSRSLSLAVYLIKCLTASTTLPTNVALVGRFVDYLHSMSYNIHSLSQARASGGQQLTHRDAGEDSKGRNVTEGPENPPLSKKTAPVPHFHIFTGPRE